MKIIMPNKPRFYQQILELESLVLKNLDEGAFSAVAFRSLNNQLFDFDGMSTLLECMPLCKEVKQYYPPLGFGKFNLTLVHNSSFFIIAMFMDDLNTEIHDHPFQGAFAPLKGMPYELDFIFDPKQDVSPWIEKGKLIIHKAQQLKPGQAKEIKTDSIHCLLRPEGGQFSILIGQILEPKKINHYYLYPDTRIKNRMDNSYLRRIFTAFECSKLEQSHLLPELIRDLEIDQVMDLFLRSGIQKMGKDAPEVFKHLRNMTIDILKEHTEIWDSILGHQNFLEDNQRKLFHIT